MPTLIQKTTRMLMALQVISRDKKISAWLLANDPKALEQVNDAIDYANRAEDLPLPQRRLTLKKKDGEFTVRITDANNKTVASYFTTDKDDANATADHMIVEHSKKATVIDTRDRSA